MSKQTELAQVADTITVDSGNVGIGTSSPSAELEVNTGAASDPIIQVTNSNAAAYRPSLGIDNQHTGGRNYRIFSTATGDGVFSGGKFVIYDNDASAGRLTIDSSGNLLVGKTSADTGATDGLELTSNGRIYASANGLSSMILNRRTTDGNLAQFKKDGSTVGSIGVAGSDFTISGVGTTSGIYFNANGLIPLLGGNLSDNTEDIGQADYRWDDIYATNGTIQTSDRNEKQDIEALSDAEQRVAVAAKGLMRKFRWRDAVEAKGDDARTHFGIIAQDLQAAFAAEGLDAGDYAMFISSTWWETQTEVPAVEAVAEVTETTTDEDGNEVVTVVTEAVEAADAYTRTDTYDTQEEAPEGATERTRLGVRYSELLAFIIGAL